MLFSFIWGSNWERIGRNILCGEIESGGAKILHLESYLTTLKIKGFTCLFDTNYFSHWKK